MELLLASKFGNDGLTVYLESGIVLVATYLLSVQRVDKLTFVGGRGELNIQWIPLKTTTDKETNQL